MTSCFCCTLFHLNSKTHVCAFTAVLSSNLFPLALLWPNLSKISSAEICPWMCCGGAVFQTASILVWHFLHGNHLFPSPTTKHHLDFHCVLLNCVSLFQERARRNMLFPPLHSFIILYNQSFFARMSEWDKQTVVTNTKLLSLFFFHLSSFFFF